MGEHKIYKLLNLREDSIFSINEDYSSDSECMLHDYYRFHEGYLEYLDNCKKKEWTRSYDAVLLADIIDHPEYIKKISYSFSENNLIILKALYDASVKTITRRNEKTECVIKHGDVLLPCYHDSMLKMCDAIIDETYPFIMKSDIAMDLKTILITGGLI